MTGVRSVARALEQSRAGRDPVDGRGRLLRQDAADRAARLSAQLVVTKNLHYIGM